MALIDDECDVTYEELAEIDRDFEDVETQLLRRKIELSRPILERRAAVLSRIPNFWPSVIEQAPPEIDENVTPSDSNLLLSSLISLHVSHFEVEGGGGDPAARAGDPRSIIIRFEFAPDNEHFDDTVLEKKLTWRRTRRGVSGFVSEPVPIRWRPGKDLTRGLLGLVCRVWEAEKNYADKADGKRALKQARAALEKKINATGLGGLSFFAWFGYRGKPISAKENRLALDRERRRRAGEQLEALPALGPGEGAEDAEDPLEICPYGDHVAMCISEELWFSAIKYYTQAQERDMTDPDFEVSDDSGADDPDEPKNIPDADYD